MIVIAHRANGFGFPENSPAGICAAIGAGFVPEVDVWYGTTLGHDRPDNGGLPACDLAERLDNPLRLGCRILVHKKSAGVLDPALRGHLSFGRRDAAPWLLEVDTPLELVEARRDFAGAVVTDDDEWLTAEEVAITHHLGRLIFVAGHNIFHRNERRWQELYRMGVDGILTDEPLALREFVSKETP